MTKEKGDKEKIMSWFFSFLYFIHYKARQWSFFRQSVCFKCHSMLSKNESRKGDIHSRLRTQSKSLKSWNNSRQCVCRRRCVCRHLCVGQHKRNEKRGKLEHLRRPKICLRQGVHRCLRPQRHHGVVTICANVVGCGATFYVTSAGSNGASSSTSS